MSQRARASQLDLQVRYRTSAPRRRRAALSRPLRAIAARFVCRDACAARPRSRCAPLAGSRVPAPTPLTAIPRGTPRRHRASLIRLVRKASSARNDPTTAGACARLGLGRRGATHALSLSRARELPQAIARAPSPPRTSPVHGAPAPSARASHPAPSIRLCGARPRSGTRSAARSRR
jgi:hypothetical protein